MMLARFAPALLVLACLTALAPTAGAQAAAGQTLLYAVATPPAGGATDLTFEAPSTDDGTASCIGDCPDIYTLTATAPPLPGAVLVSSESLEAVAWFKSWNNAPSPGTAVAFAVQFDGVEVAQGSKTSDVMLGAIVEFRVAMPYTGPAEIPAGTVVTWIVTASNSACECYLGTAYPRGVSGEHPWSIGLPGAISAAGGASAPESANLTGATANIQTAFPNATTGTYLYHWNGSAEPLGLVASANGTGLASLAVVDAANTTLFESNLTAAAQTALINGTAGNWTLRLHLQEFVGNITVTLGPQDEELPETTPSPAPSSGSSSTGPTNRTTNQTSADPQAEDTPAPSAAVLALALVVAAFAIRRRP